MKVIAISGSLRKASTNTGLLREAIEQMPKGMIIKLYSIDDFPLYNEDLVVNGVKPKVILDAYEDFATADAFLFGAPCYNHSLSSPLKNVIDWISRDKSPFRGKPLGYLHSGWNPHNYVEPALKVVVQWLNMKVNTDKKSFFMIPENFDKKGNLINPDLKKQVAEYVNGFKEFIEEHKKQGTL